MQFDPQYLDPDRNMKSYIQMSGVGEGLWVSTCIACSKVQSLELQSRASVSKQGNDTHAHPAKLPPGNVEQVAPGYVNQESEVFPQTVELGCTSGS